MSTATDLPAPVIPARHRRELEGVAGLLTRRATGSSDGGNGIASSSTSVSDRDPAAIDREHDTVGERRLRRGQVDDGCGDLLRGA